MNAKSRKHDERRNQKDSPDAGGSDQHANGKCREQKPGGRNQPKATILDTPPLTCVRGVKPVLLYRPSYSGV